MDGVESEPAATVNQTNQESAAACGRKDIVMRKVDTDKHFRETQRAFASGGDTKMFRQQMATTKVPGRAGKLDMRGPGEQFADGGANRTPGRASRVGVAAPSAPGRTGNVHGPAARSSRNYGKPK
jgi:hypothetical protein